MDRISIITVHYNQPEVTVAFLTSVRKYCATLPVEVILVDNAPVQDYEPRFKTAYPELVYIRSDQNTGFAGGNNLGIRQSKGEYILLLNNDTELTEGFLETLIETMESNPQIGLLSPLIKFFHEKDRIQYAGFTKMNYYTGRNNTIGYYEPDRGQYHKDYETGFCHGAAMLCRKQDLQKAGLMEELYFLYYEELDWCEKFKRIGKKTWFTGKAQIYHKESASVGKMSPVKSYFMTRNRMLYIRRNAPFFPKLVFTLYYSLLVCPVKIIKLLLQSNTSLALQTFRGLKWNFTHSKNSDHLGYPIP
ncbi:glycosyl transferase [Niabella ginsenosidivorans]|uniref:Glycosyl transferase n=1 Tax=Niabella ginsenosidivorans TaxID=1176587 RepID=A0A1A9I2P3_9BACT|nr:glycosyltransferase family 2 protein [Niabella ginsenosidivorans]ANH81927.1 glycosyl transferase [Niabella ginsenosidivorans]